MQRYIERCRPDYKFAKARDEMILRMEGVPLVAPHDAPGWCRSGGEDYKGNHGPRHVGFLFVAGDVVFAVSSYRTSEKGVRREKVATVLVKEAAHV